MKRKLSIQIILAALVFSVSSMPVEAGKPIHKRLGYGFEPGLLPGRDFVAAQLIVGLRESMGIGGPRKAASLTGIPVVKEIRGALLLQFASEQAALDAVSALLARPEVKFLERNGFVRIRRQLVPPYVRCGGCSRAARRAPGRLAVSNDPATGYQWHHLVIRKTARDLPPLSATPPTVAVVDTGVDYTHPDLTGKGKVILGKNCVAETFDPMDDHGHGTHLAGTIAARAGNSQNGEGVCPDCKILAVKVLNSSGEGTFFDVAAGMEYARTVSTIPPTKVILMGSGSAHSALIAAEVLAIKNAGKLLVAEAGSDDSSTGSSFPGADPNTGLRVMATIQNDCRAWFSNFSPSSTPSLYNMAAPGWDIRSPLPEGGFGSWSGTSMASAVAAGSAALVWGQWPALTSSELISRLLAHGQSTGCGFAVSTPRVDVRKAILGTSETAEMGQVLDPFTGKPASPNSVPFNIKLYSGSTLLASAQTDRAGFYAMTALTPGTDRSLTAERSGYLPSILRYPVATSSGTVGGPYQDACVRARSNGSAAITLDWRTGQPLEESAGCSGACLGWEMDLFLKMPDGTYIGWDQRGDLLTPPYAFYPRDSYDDLLPMETIVISASAPDGTYKIFVDKPVFDGLWNPSWTNSQASVQVYGGSGALSGHYSNSPAACGSTYRYWYLGDITKSGTSLTWTSVNLCTNTQP